MSAVYEERKKATRTPPPLPTPPPTHLPTLNAHEIDYNQQRRPCRRCTRSGRTRTASSTSPTRGRTPLAPLRSCWHRHASLLWAASCRRRRSRRHRGIDGVWCPAFLLARPSERWAWGLGLYISRGGGGRVVGVLGCLSLFCFWLAPPSRGHEKQIRRTDGQREICIQHTRLINHPHHAGSGFSWEGAKGSSCLNMCRGDRHWGEKKIYT